MIEMRWLVGKATGKVLQYRQQTLQGWSEWCDVPTVIERDMDCP
jgi:hypothetical protein